MNLYTLTNYMIENKLFKSKEEAMQKISICFMIRQLTQEQMQELSLKVADTYKAAEPVPFVPSEPITESEGK